MQTKNAAGTVPAPYETWRNAGLTATTALQLARHEEGKDRQRLLIEGRRATAIMAGVRVTITLNNDPLGWAKYGRTVYGELVEEWEPGDLRTPPGSEKPFFRPADSYWNMRRAMEKQKMPKEEGDRIARRVLRAQMQRTLTYGTKWEYALVYFQLEYKRDISMHAIEGVEFDLDAPSRPLQEMLYREAYRRVLQLRREVGRG